MNYLAIINDKQVGPYTVEQLVQMGLKPNNFVWCQGMSEWKEACAVPDFNEAFTNSVPPVAPPKAFSKAIVNSTPRSSAGNALLPIVVIALCLLIGIFDAMIFREARESVELRTLFLMQTNSWIPNHSPSIHDVPTVWALFSAITMIVVLIATYYMWIKCKKNLIINTFATITTVATLIFTTILIFKPEAIV